MQTSGRTSSKKKGGKPSVFEYSVALAGVGRGRGVLQMFQSKEPQVCYVFYYIVQSIIIFTLRNVFRRKKIS